MKDMGKADVILRMKISRTPNEITLFQSLYVDKVVERFKSHNIERRNRIISPLCCFS